MLLTVCNQMGQYQHITMLSRYWKTRGLLASLPFPLWLWTSSGLVSGTFFITYIDILIFHQSATFIPHILLLLSPGRLPSSTPLDSSSYAVTTLNQPGTLKRKRKTVKLVAMVAKKVVQWCLETRAVKAAQKVPAVWTQKWQCVANVAVTQRLLRLKAVKRNPRLALAVLLPPAWVLSSPAWLWPQTWWSTSQPTVQGP